MRYNYEYLHEEYVAPLHSSRVSNMFPCVTQCFIVSVTFVFVSLCSAYLCIVLYIYIYIYIYISI
jgi:hypothetical protein